MSKHRRHRRSDFKIAHNPLRSSSSRKERKILFSEKFIAISSPRSDIYLDDFRLFTIPHEHYTNLATHGQLDFNSTFWYVWEMIRKKAKTLLRVERTFVRRLVIAMTESFAGKNTKKMKPICTIRSTGSGEKSIFHSHNSSAFTGTFFLLPRLVFFVFLFRSSSLGCELDGLLSPGRLTIGKGPIGSLVSWERKAGAWHSIFIIVSSPIAGALIAGRNEPRLTECK